MKHKGLIVTVLVLLVGVLTTAANAGPRLLAPTALNGVTKPDADD
jgi:hypothetical protein